MKGQRGEERKEEQDRNAGHRGTRARSEAGTASIWGVGPGKRIDKSPLRDLPPFLHFLLCPSLPCGISC